MRVSVTATSGGGGRIRQPRAAAAVVVSSLTFGAALAALHAPNPEPARDRRTVSLTATFVPPAPPPGAGTVRLWIPVPASTSFQVLGDITLSPALPYRTVVDREYGNRFLSLDPRPGTLASGRPLSVTFRVTRMAFPSGTAEDAASPPRLLERFLRPDRLVPVDGVIAAEAHQVAGTGGTALERARRLYDHIVATVRYEKTGTGWGRGDALWVCDSRHGNCTDFHSLFIGEARSLGIPARFVMGVPLPPDRSSGEIAGYHCWAEFFVPGRGWVPVDASEASQDPARRDELFDGLDANRIQFTTGRDIELPGAHWGPVNYAIYPLAEVGGQPLQALETHLSFRDAGTS